MRTKPEEAEEQKEADRRESLRTSGGADRGSQRVRSFSVSAWPRQAPGEAVPTFLRGANLLSRP